MFNLFKSTQQKEASLQKELDLFRAKNQQFFNCLCWDGSRIVVYRDAEIQDGRIILKLLSNKTPEGFVSVCELDWMIVAFGDDFIKKQRIAFLKLKEELKAFRYQISPIAPSEQPNGPNEA